MKRLFLFVRGVKMHACMARLDLGRSLFRFKPTYRQGRQSHERSLGARNDTRKVPFDLNCKTCGVLLFSFILCVCFLASAIASEGLEAGQKAQNNKEIKSLYRQAICDYKHDCLEESSRAFEEILSLDSSQKKASYFLENRIPHKFVEREAKKQERCRLEKLRASYNEKKEKRRAEHDAKNKNNSNAAERHHHPCARSLFVNEDGVL